MSGRTQSRTHSAPQRGKAVVTRALRLSRELREGRGGYLSQRRAIVGLSLIAIGAMGVITLYQMGIIRHLPEPPLPRLDADRVDASEEAYSRFETPDAALALGNYAATLGLAAMAGRSRVKTKPWLPLALSAKAGFDAFQGARLIRDQTVKQKAYCIWCLLAAAVSFAMFPLSLPEARAALRRWRSGPTSERRRGAL